MFGTIFEMGYGNSFVNARMTDIAQDLLVWIFFSRAKITNDKHQVCVIKWLLRSPRSFDIEYSGAPIFGIAHIDDKIQSFCPD